MEATRSDVFALKNSGLEAFLYADVGAEANGSALTMLSVLARLGKDPWAEAARWAALPKTAVIDSLAQSIGQMPLVPADLAQSCATAARLVQLLPATAQSLWPSRAAKADTPLMPEWVPITLLYCALAFGMALNAFLMPKPSHAVAKPIEQSMAVPGATAAVVSNLQGKPVVSPPAPPPGQ